MELVSIGYDVGEECFCSKCIDWYFIVCKNICENFCCGCCIGVDEVVFCVVVV